MRCWNEREELDAVDEEDYRDGVFPVPITLYLLFTWSKLRLMLKTLTSIMYLQWKLGALYCRSLCDDEESIFSFCTQLSASLSSHIASWSCCFLTLWQTMQQELYFSDLCFCLFGKLPTEIVAGSLVSLLWCYHAMRHIGMICSGQWLKRS